MHYISQNPGGGATHLQLASSVYGLIGTPPQWRRPSRLCWKQGPCLLYEDVTSPHLARMLHQLGPHYLGSLQAPQIHSTNVQPSQIAEEKMVLGLNAVAVTQMTLAKIRKVYSKVDNKSIAKQLGMAAGENATPIRVVHNASGHLLGPARSLGGVVIGYLGVRVFSPQPVSKVIETVGGCNVLLGLVAMATDMESLYAGVKALVCVLKSNPFAYNEMEAIKGYQTLGMLLRKKLPLLNAHILYLVFTLAGTIDTAARDVSGIPNVAAFRDVLCDLELWHGAPPDVEKSLFDHFSELVKNSAGNTRKLRDFSLVDKLLGILTKSEKLDATLMNVLHGLLCSAPRVTDVLNFALFTASTLTATDEKNVELKVGTDGTEWSTEINDEARTIALRNRCLKLFFSLLYVDDGNKIHATYCEDVVQVVGFDWILLFLQGHLHPTTVVWGLRILMTLLSQPPLLTKFRNGSCNGHWLLKSENVLQNKMVKALGGHNGGNGGGGGQMKGQIRQDIFAVPGFQLLNWLMPYHTEIPEVYFLLMAMALGQPVKTLPEALHLDLDSVWNFIFGTTAAETSHADLAGVNLSGDTLVTILCMVRALLNHETAETLSEGLKEYPVTLTQFLFYLYHNAADFMPVFMTDQVLTALAGTLFPATPASPTKKDQHPARRNVIHFMKTLIVDALSLPVSNKTPPTLDLLLDAQPDQTTQRQQCRFQTDLLAVIMDHLLAADILIGDGAALPIVPGGSQHYVAPNVFYLASRLVDKMWQGIIDKDPDDVFTFVLKLISQAKRRGEGSLNLEGIYRCLNRTVLYMLSRPHSSVANQMTVLDVLHKIVTERNILFGAGNHDLEFFGCLTYCLLQLQASKTIPIESNGGTSVWHDDDVNEDLENSEDVNKHQGQNLLSNASSRVWELMYAGKRPALEETFKCSFGQSNNVTPSLTAIRANLLDQATKIWFAYLDVERSVTKIPAWEFHTSQLESRIQRFTGGLTGGLKRLTSVGSNASSAGASAVKKEDVAPKINPSPLSKTAVESATLNHIAIVKDVVDQSYKNRLQTEQHMLKYLEEEWLETEGQLTQERGLWGPFNESPLTKWMLDMTEGPSRMRRKMMRNQLFYLQYPYKPGDEVDQKALSAKYRRPSSLDSKLWYEKHRSIAMFERSEDSEDLVVEYDDCDVTVRDLSIDEQIRKIGFQGLTAAAARRQRRRRQRRRKKT